jgi:hypothetical protein
VAKPVTPTRPATNLAATATVTNTIIGRDVPLTSTAIPTLDPVTGQFSGPFPPADQAVIQFAGGLNTQLVTAGSSRVRLDGIGLGDARNTVPAHYTFTSLSPADTVQFSLDIDPAFAQATTVDTSPSFPAALTDPALGVKFEGVASAAPVPGEVAFGFPNYQQIQAQDRGCSDGSFAAADGTTGCFYNGPRWFAGDNETQPDPNAGEAADGSGTVPAGFSLNNAGALPGVTTIFSPMTSGNVSADWRGVDAALGGAARAADFKVYWGNPGKIDSIIDVTHNVPVPFLRDSIGGGFGVLNVSGSNVAGSSDGQTGVVTINDLGCVEPLRSGAAGTGAQVAIPCTSATPYFLSDSAELNPVGIYTGAPTAATTVVPVANGFLLYIAGRISVFQLAGATLPSATVWTLRTYSGWISGGNGAGGSLGPYVFTPGPRPFTAIGAEIELQYNVVAGVNPVAVNDLSRVHTVPDPYYVQSKFEASTDQKVLKFVGLPQDCIIRIYSVSGVLVRVLEHHSGNYSSRSTAQGSEHDWDLRNRNNQVVASGVYFWHVEAGDARKVGRFTLVNFAQ